jgi:hypothetical protein
METLSNAIDSHVMEYQSKLHLPHIEFWYTTFPSLLDHAFPYVQGHSALFEWILQMQLVSIQKWTLQVYIQIYEVMRIIDLYTLRITEVFVCL